MPVPATTITVGLDGVCAEKTLVTAEGLNYTLLEVAVLRELLYHSTA